MYNVTSRAPVTACFAFSVLRFLDTHEDSTKRKLRTSQVTNSVE